MWFFRAFGKGLQAHTKRFFPLKSRTIPHNFKNMNLKVWALKTNVKFKFKLN